MTKTAVAIGSGALGGKGASRLAFAEALRRVIADPTESAAIVPLPVSFGGQDAAEDASRRACRFHYGQHDWSAAALATG